MTRRDLPPANVWLALGFVLALAASVWIAWVIVTWTAP